MIVRAMHVGDLDAVARVHLAAFPSFFLSFLGPRFLGEFYGAVLREGIALVAVDEERVQGFVAGVLDPRGFYRRFMLRRFAHVAVAIIPPLLRRPSTLLRVLRRVRQRTGESPFAGAELMSLAVLPDEQHRGVGRGLVREFVDRVRDRGMNALWLVTDAHHNDAVLAFYERLGFERRRSFTNAEGRVLAEYVRTSEALS